MGARVNLQSRRALLKQFAPQYREASSAQKRVLLDTFAQATGYHRRYGMWLLNHAEDVLHVPAYKRASHYGPDVQHALFLVWNAANRICAKRLIPILPTILDSLERHGHIQLSEESRRQLLSMSAATADRLLRAHRHTTARGLSTTKAGPLLKQQIPIRTFAQWDEAQPGFLEADLVAHCGGHLEGGCLYTLTLTDVATGWTECLPLLNRGERWCWRPCKALAGCSRFPSWASIPIMGESSSTRKWPPIVRTSRSRSHGDAPMRNVTSASWNRRMRSSYDKVVGHGRLIGDHACQQLAELYRALRLYVNCFQPSMKLVAKQVEGRTVRRVYDAARTPLQRLLLSGVLPASRQQELSAAAMALDPIGLLHHVEQLQQAVLRCEVSGSSAGQQTSATSLLKFELEDGTTKPLLSEEMGHDEGSVSENGGQGPRENTHVLDWRRTSKDPFADQWEQILSWIQANPTRSSGDIFRELQSLFPGRYQPLHIRSLQRGMRRIRAHVLEMREEPRQKEVIHGDLPSPVELHQAKPVPEGIMRLSSRFAPARPVDPSAGETSTPFSPHHPTAEDQSMHTPVRECEAPAKSEPHIPLPGRGNCLTIEGAIQSYLQTHDKARHGPKTLEWHQMALRHLQHYLLAERHLLLVSQIRETDIRGWVAFLAQTPSATSKLRSASTIETYARSARAFCTWLVTLVDPDEAELYVENAMTAKVHAERDKIEKQAQLVSAEEAMQEIKKKLLTQGIDENEEGDSIPESEERCIEEAVEEERRASSCEQAAQQQRAAEQAAQQQIKECTLQIEGLGRVYNQIQTIQNGYASLLATVPTSEAVPDLVGFNPSAFSEEAEITFQPDDIDHTLRDIEDRLKHMQEERESLDRRSGHGSQIMSQALNEVSREFKEVTLAKRLLEYGEGGFEQHCRRLLPELSQRQSMIQEQRKNLQASRDILIQQLLALADAGIAFLNSAAKYSKLPATLPAFEQRPFLRIHLTEPASREERVGKVADLLDRIVREKEIPNGIELLQQAVRRLASPITVQILFPDPADLQYVPPTRMMKESGGERLTSMVLLYCTLLRMRAAHRTKPAGKSSCLILDNPMGVASRATFLELQREVAQVMNIQLTYTTAIKDFEALHVFPNIIRIRNDQLDRRTGYHLMMHDTSPEGLEAMRIMHSEERDFSREHQDHES